MIKYLEAGNSQRAASRVFQLSPTTVNTWDVRHKKEGQYCIEEGLYIQPLGEEENNTYYNFFAVIYNKKLPYVFNIDFDYKCPP